MISENHWQRRGYDDDRGTVGSTGEAKQIPDRHWKRTFSVRSAVKAYEDYTFADLLKEYAVSRLV
tara:strand:- start:101 stop:295 length:195 start_codon:yes stop_codon:yes gene_type:complete